MKAYISIATAFGTAALLCMAGVWLGQRMPWESQNGFYDLRELPRFMASLAFGLVGLIGGGYLGRAIGRRLAETPQTGVVAASLILILPVAIYAFRQARIHQDVQRRLAQNEQRSSAESQRQQMDQKQWLASSQYAEMVERQMAMAERFKLAMAPITFPGATLVDQPYPRTLVFESADDFDTANDALRRLPVEMGRRVDTGRKQQLAYFQLEGFKGSIRVVPRSQGGVSITYTLEG